MVMPNSERKVRNLFVANDAMANETLSFNKPKTIIQKPGWNFTNVPKKIAGELVIFKRSKKLGNWLY